MIASHAERRRDLVSRPATDQHAFHSAPLATEQHEITRPYAKLISEKGEKGFVCLSFHRWSSNPNPQHPGTGKGYFRRTRAGHYTHAHDHSIGMRFKHLRILQHDRPVARRLAGARSGSPLPTPTSANREKTSHV